MLTASLKLDAEICFTIERVYEALDNQRTCGVMRKASGTSRRARRCACA